MTLYHLTWKIRVPSIMELGLVPSFMPNKWAVATARQMSKGKTYLCNKERRGYWQMIFEEGWAGDPPRKNAALAWLAIDAAGLNLTSCASTEIDDYTGDFWCVEPIPASRIVKVSRALAS